MKELYKLIGVWILVAVMVLGSSCGLPWKGESVGRKYSRLSNQLAFALSEANVVFESLSNIPGVDKYRLGQALVFKDRLDRTNLEFIRAARKFVVCKGVEVNGQCQGARVIELKEDGIVRIRDAAQAFTALGAELIRQNWNVNDPVANSRLALLANGIALAATALGEFIIQLVKKAPNSQFLDEQFQQQEKMKIAVLGMTDKEFDDLTQVQLWQAETNVWDTGRILSSWQIAPMVDALQAIPTGQ